MKKIFTLIGGLVLAGTMGSYAETVTLYPMQYVGDNYVSVADSQQTEISKDEEGNIIIADFLYSDAPLYFKFEIPEVGNYADITFTGYLDRETAKYPYFMDAEGYYPSFYLWNYNNVEDWTQIKWPYLSEDGYSCVYRYDLTDPENEGYKEYYGCINLSGTAENGDYFPWTYIEFYFDIPEATAVDSIASSSDATVEYFNISGQRIDNPQGGIFIRKQGDKTSKIVIR